MSGNGKTATKAHVQPCHPLLLALMARRVQSISATSMEKRFDVHNPAAIPKVTNQSVTQPGTLQECCRATILQNAGLEKCHDLRKELDLPHSLLEFLTTEFGTDDFFVNKEDVTSEDIASGTYKATCLLDQKHTLLKCIPNHVMTDGAKSVASKWMLKDIDGVQKCLVSFKEEDKDIFVLQYLPHKLPFVIKSLKSKDKQMSESLIWYIVENIAKALRALNAKGIQYKDLKPEKVGFLSTCDLKLENQILHISEQTSVMEQFVMVDDVQPGIYTPPEIISGEEPNDKSVIWVLGSLLYELAAQRPAYIVDDAANIFAALNEVVEGNMPQGIGEKYSSSLQDFIYSCLNPDKDQRPDLSEVLQKTESELMSKENLKDELKACFTN